MNITIEKFSTCNAFFFETASKIRTEVFVKEQNVPADLEYDGLDNDAAHFLLFSDGIPCVTARYRNIDGKYKLERFATLKHFRGSKLGEKLLLHILSDLIPKKKPIYLNSQDSAVGFYLKYGFKIEGEEFYEAGIKHFKMLYSEE
jgi:predicted GNAT family N-acyltransferase